jgi:hypothetical protein
MPWLSHRLADGMLYGRIGRCPECGSDAMAHDSVKYKCYGNVSEFTKCDFEGDSDKIERFKFQIPKKGFPKAIMGYEFSKSHPTKKFVALKTQRDDDSSEPEAAPKKKGKKAAASTEAPAAVKVDEGQEAKGMKIAIQGTKGNLDSFFFFFFLFPFLLSFCM